MLETGVRQFRMVIGMVWGRRLDPDNIARLVSDAVATIDEFGEPGADSRELTEGPLADPETRLDFANRALRRTARRLAKQSAFYARRLQSAEIDLSKLDIDSISGIPVTTKRDLVANQSEFQCADVKPQLATRTTGTTGQPTEVWISRRELGVWSGLSALTGVLRDEISPSDVYHMHLSSRATIAIHLNAAVCRMVGAQSRILGVIPAEQAVQMLSSGGATLMACNASYLAELVLAARRLGMSESDFRLKRIDIGGELLSSRVKTAALETFGARANDVYSMTEIAPVSASTCSQSHLHYDINMGLVELLDLETGEPAQPGALCTLAVTPYYPYRECMPVFRYDTRDVVRKLDDVPLTCEIAGLPASGPILGKADQILRLGTQDVLTPRALVEAIEELPSDPWPARFDLAIHDGRARLRLPAGALAGLSSGDAREHFLARHLDVDLVCVADDKAASLRPLRSDLRETTFSAQPAMMNGD